MRFRSRATNAATAYSGNGDSLLRLLLRSDLSGRFQGESVKLGAQRGGRLMQFTSPDWQTAARAYIRRRAAV